MKPDTDHWVLHRVVSSVMYLSVAIPLIVGGKVYNSLKVVMSLKLIVVFGFLWKRNAATAVTTLIVAWIANSVWSFTPLPGMLNLSELPNAYVTLAMTLLVGIGMNVVAGGQPGYLRSDEHLARLGTRSPDA